MAFACKGWTHWQAGCVARPNGCEGKTDVRAGDLHDVDLVCKSLGQDWYKFMLKLFFVSVPGVFVSVPPSLPITALLRNKRCIEQYWPATGLTSGLH